MQRTICLDMDIVRKIDECQTVAELTALENLSNAM